MTTEYILSQWPLLLVPNALSLPPGMDLYFKRHDGHAVTCDDFLAAMADANGVNLDTLGRWGQARGCVLWVVCIMVAAGWRVAASRPPT